MTNRKKFITDVVEKYIKDNQEEYKEFIKMVEWKRKVSEDKKFASIKGTSETRLVGQVPQPLMNVFEYFLKEEKIFEPKGETKWFFKKFPQFLIPRQY